MSKRTTSLEVDGPAAVERTKSVLDSLTADEESITRISIEVEESIQNGEDDPEADALPEESHGWPTEPSEMAAGEREGPSGQPRPPSGGTHRHIALVCLAWTIEDNDIELADRKQVAEQPFCPLTARQIGNSLSGVFRDNNLLFREPRAGQGGRSYVYGLTETGWEVADSLGQFDTDAEPPETE